MLMTILVMDYDADAGAKAETAGSLGLLRGSHRDFFLLQDSPHFKTPDVMVGSCVVANRPRITLGTYPHIQCKHPSDQQMCMYNTVMCKIFGSEY